MQLGIRQARYVGRAKTLFQMRMAATVANLTLVAGRMDTALPRCQPGLIPALALAGFLPRL